jgi:hypothetical protein
MACMVGVDAVFVSSGETLNALSGPVRATESSAKRFCQAREMCSRLFPVSDFAPALDVWVMDDVCSVKETVVTVT